MRKKIDVVLKGFLLVGALIALGVIAGEYLASRFGHQGEYKHPYFQTVGERFQEDEITEGVFIPPVVIQERTEAPEIHIIVFKDNVLGNVFTFPDKKAEILIFKEEKFYWTVMDGEEILVEKLKEGEIFIKRKEGGINFAVLELELRGGEEDKK